MSNRQTGPLILSYRLVSVPEEVAAHFCSIIYFILSYFFPQNVPLSKLFVCVALAATSFECLYFAHTLFLQTFNYENTKPRVNNVEIIHAFKESKEADSQLLSQQAI